MHRQHTGLLIPILIVALLIVGAVVGAITIAMSKKRRSKGVEWVHAAYSIWTGGDDSATWAADRAKKSLASWYSAPNVGTFWNVIKDLRAGTTGNVAWDRVRALDILRIGMAAGYIDGDQCQTQGAGIGQELQAKYGSWEELAQAFEAGMHTWQKGSGVNDTKELGRVQRNLPVLREKIWPSVPWSSPLDPAD
jgi:hypothetical protein